MAVLISCATGNFTAAATWALVDSTSYLNSESTATALTTSYVTSSTFTPGAITIDGIAIKLANRAGTTGTMSVALDQGGATVTNTEVAIDCADLPAATTALADGGWILFKFSTSVTLAAATAYSVKAKTSTSGQVSLFRDSTAGNWSRCLRTTTTQAPAAGDSLIVIGEHTGAGTGNSFTVTMDETATTDYGSGSASLVTPALAICQRGTLSYGTAASTNYYLKLSDHAIVYCNGTLNIGSVGGEIPRTSTAVLEFDCVTDGDFGLIGRRGGTINMQGLSRTSGKNIVQCKLNADAPSSPNLLTVGVTASQGLGVTLTNMSVSVTSATSLDPIGSFGLGVSATDTVTNATHGTGSSATGSVTNTTQVYTIWLRRGSGTNNRYVRMVYGSAVNAAPTNGFYADIDLQAGTIGACTALGNGTATSSAITAVSDGYLCTIIGKASSGALSPFASVWACSAAGTTSYAGDATNNFVYYAPQVFTAAAQPSGTLTVDTDTGWLAGDAIAVAATSRTRTECESNILASNATSTTLPCALTLDCSHSGTSPTQAEIILLTRNVKVRGGGTNKTAMAYAAFTPGCAIDIDWVEFYYIGHSTTGKRGIEFTLNATDSTNASLNYCSIHNTENNGLTLSLSSAATITLLSISNLVMWNGGTSVGPPLQMSSAIDVTNFTLDTITVIRSASGTAITLTDLGGTYKNLTAVGAASAGITFSPGGVETFGICENITAHTNAVAGVSFATSSVSSGLIKNLTAWRNGGAGLLFTTLSYDVTLDSPVMFGNSTSNIQINNMTSLTVRNMVSNGDSSFSTSYGIFQNFAGVNSGIAIARIENSDFSTVSGIKTAHNTADINVAADSAQVTIWNTKLGAGLLTGGSEQSEKIFLVSDRHNQVAGNHYALTFSGTITTDGVIYRTAAPSMRVQPTSWTQNAIGTFTNASATVTNVSFVDAETWGWAFLRVGMAISALNTQENARIVSWDAVAGTITMDLTATASLADDSILFLSTMESTTPFGGVKAPVASSGTLTPSVYVRKSATADGFGLGYTGDQPRLLLKANPALGIDDDVVLDEMTGGNGTWEQLSATTPAASDDGVMEFVVDCNGTVGFINIDDWSIA